MTHGRDMTHLTKKSSEGSSQPESKILKWIFLVFMCVMSRPMVIIKVLYDTKIDQEIQGGHPVKKYD